MASGASNVGRRTFIAGAAAAGLAGPWPARAQAPAARTVTLIVPFAPGGATDITARRLAERMSVSLEAPVVIENRPGAGGFPAVQAMLAAPRDGRTLMMSGTASISLMPLVYSRLPFRMEDLVPLSLVSRQPFTVNGSLAASTGSIDRFLAYARSRPDGVTFGTTGIGTIGHILAEWVGQTLGIKYQTIPYKGVSQAAIDLMAGRIDAMVDGMTSGVAAHKTGKTRLLGALGQAGERSALPQDVQNFADMGYPDLVAHVELGLFVARGTADTALKRLFDAVVAATRNPEFASGLAANGETAMASASPSEFAARIDGERARWAPIARQLNIDLS